MKPFKIILILACLFLGTKQMQAQVFDVCIFYDGYWTDWGAWKSSLYRGSVEANGDYDNMNFYYKKDGVHQAFFYFRINNLSGFPDKRQRKKDEDAGAIYYYDGYVEYYVTDDDYNMSWPDKCRKYSYRNGSDLANAIFTSKNGKKPRVKVKKPARIGICAFKKHPRVWIINFEGIALEIKIHDKGVKFNQTRFDL